MPTDFSGFTVKRSKDENLDDFVARVLRSIEVPACINTIAILTGLAPHRVCKILNRLERNKRIKKTTNIYHAYWQLI